MRRNVKTEIGDGDGPGKKGRKSEIVASDSMSRTTEFLDDSNLDEFDEFSERLANVSSQAISNGVESEESDVGRDTGTGESETSRRMRQSFWAMLTIPIILAIVVTFWIGWNPDVSEYSYEAISRRTKKDGEAPKPKMKPENQSWRTNLEKNGRNYRLFSEKEIEYSKDGPMYLVIAGHIFDVSQGGNMYAEGSGYHGFIGKDGTRAFVTGKFDEEGLIPDLEGLSSEDFKGISGWIDFYLNHEKYEFMGVLKGWFFDDAGKPTNNLRELMKNADMAEEKAKAQLKVEEQFPTCNIEWSAELGSRVWCSSGSGGIQRSWVGVPRLFTEEGKDARCACVDINDLTDPRLKEYRGCSTNAVDCKILE